MFRASLVGLSRSPGVATNLAFRLRAEGGSLELGASPPTLSRGALGELRHELRALLELRGEPELVRIQRWRATLPRFDLEHPARVAAIEAACPPSLVLLGNWLHGIGVNHLVAHAHQRAAS